MNQILTTAAVAFLCAGCGESKKEQAQRESAERDRQLVRELQRNENIQREKDRDQKNAETIVRALDVLTR